MPVRPAPGLVARRALDRGGLGGWREEEPEDDEELDELEASAPTGGIEVGGPGGRHRPATADIIGKKRDCAAPDEDAIAVSTPGVGGGGSVALSGDGGKMGARLDKVVAYDISFISLFLVNVSNIIYRY